MNDIIHTIQSRRSIGNLSLPMPSDDELQIALQCAMTAPDHKQLKPWQCVVMTDDALDRFGQVLLKAGQDRTGLDNALDDGNTLDEATRNKLLNMPKRAPMVVMIATNIKPHEKVPPFEQLLSTGAMIQNFLLALESLGYHSVWRTGDLANAPAVKQHFDIADKDTICGFIYVGSSDIIMPNRETIKLDEVVTFAH